MKNLNNVIIILCAILLVVLFVLGGSGCKSLSFINPLSDNTPQVETAKGRFQDAVKSTSWLLTLSILGMAISIFAMLNGSKWALSSLAGSGLAFGLSLMVSRYAEVLAFVMLICILGGIGFVVYSVVVKKKAFKEIIQTVENVKTKLKNGDKEELFDNKNNPDSAESIQSNSTKKIVKEVKEKIK